MRTLLLSLACLAAGPALALPTLPPSQSASVAPEAGRAAPDAVPAEERESAGKIDLLEGEVRILENGKTRRAAKVGDAVYEGDNIVTGAGGELHLTMQDGGFLGVRPGTQMTIVNYRAQGDDGDSVLLELLRGSFRSITGWVARHGARRYAVKTPSATIAVRGTDHEPKVIPEGSTVGTPGTYDKVNAGGTTIQNAKGKVDIAAGNAGYAAQVASAAPSALASVPPFFTPTRNEKRMEGLHARIQPRLEQLRVERQRVIHERRERQERVRAERRALQERVRAERAPASSKHSAPPAAPAPRPAQGPYAAPKGQAKQATPAHPNARPSAMPPQHAGAPQAKGNAHAEHKPPAGKSAPRKAASKIRQ